METKSPVKSKTIYANILATGIVPILTHFGIKVTPEMVAAILAAVNIGLRFVTKGSIGFGTSGIESKVIESLSKISKDLVVLSNACKLLYNEVKKLNEK